MQAILDLWLLAQTIVDQHGADALTLVAQHVTEMADNGDLDGQRAWLTVQRMIETLLLHSTPGGPSQH